MTRYWMVLTALAAAAAPSAHADFNSNCDARLRLAATELAAKAFPGRPVVVEFAPTEDHGNVYEECVEIRDGENPARVLGVYRTLIDEVCGLNDGFQSEPGMISCSHPGNHHE